jgi:hypothetical protein
VAPVPGRDNSASTRAARPARHEHIKVATVGNPGLHMATWVGGLPGVSSVMTHYMAHKMGELDIPSIPAFIEMIADTGAGLYGCKASVDLFGLTKDRFSSTRSRTSSSSSSSSPSASSTTWPLAARSSSPDRAMSGRPHRDRPQTAASGPVAACHPDHDSRAAVRNCGCSGAPLRTKDPVSRDLARVIIPHRVFQ